MLELPKSRFRRSGVKNVADYIRVSQICFRQCHAPQSLTFVKAIHVELPNKRGDVSMLEVLTVAFQQQIP